MKNIYIIFLMISVKLFGQNVSENTFLKDGWFSSNALQTAKVNDSVKIFYVKNSWSDDRRQNKRDILCSLNKSSSISSLRFKRSGELDIRFNQNNGWCGTQTQASILLWKFDEKSQYLKIMKGEEVLSIFKIIGNDENSKSWKSQINGVTTNFYIELISLNLLKIE